MTAAGQWRRENEWGEEGEFIVSSVIFLKLDTLLVTKGGNYEGHMLVMSKTVLCTHRVS